VVRSGRGDDTAIQKLVGERIGLYCDNARRRAVPFRPFVLKTADGERLPVPHPELIAHAPGRRTAAIALDDGSIATVDLLLVSSILEQPAEAPGSGSSLRRRKRRPPASESRPSVSRHASRSTLPRRTGAFRCGSAPRPTPISLQVVTEPHVPPAEHPEPTMVMVQAGLRSGACYDRNSTFYDHNRLILRAGQPASACRDLPIPPPSFANPWRLRAKPAPGTVPGHLVRLLQTLQFVMT
jgi:hypothetical protein